MYVNFTIGFIYSSFVSKTNVIKKKYYF
jgi:hypothetical protein